ncbi:unnamed protein product [Phyllotreta striolata]|uniref:Uncharacterized protein n=1 Tax=Phyllotreta striolata TaxID=444603 RepID=A0A9N9TQU4_PHYSR|nr:unnamed protein product [Phyllotreta striolata]
MHQLMKQPRTLEDILNMAKKQDDLKEWMKKKSKVMTEKYKEELVKNRSYIVGSPHTSPSRAKKSSHGKNKGEK